jgi:hypothetical protein
VVSRPGAVKRGALEVLDKVWELLPFLETQLGKLAKDMEARGVPPDRSFT